METWARDLVFSQERLSLASLRARHPSLPVLVKVLEDTSHTGGLCPEQILVFHMWINQERMIGRNTKGDTISIPINSTQMFKVLGADTTTQDDTKTKGLSIPNILKTHKLPVTVQAGDSQANASTSHGTDAGTSQAASTSHGTDAGTSQSSSTSGGFTWESFGKIILVSTHKITYGLASVLTTGEAEVCQLFPVPVCRPLQLQVATELNVLQAAFLEDHTEQITELLTSVSHHPAEGSQQVQSLPSIGVTDYRELLRGETLLSAASPNGKGAPSLLPAVPTTQGGSGNEEAASSTESKQDTLLAAVDRFTHYQSLLSSSPKTERRGGDNGGKHQSPQHKGGPNPAAGKPSPAQKQVPRAKPNTSKHKFGPASPSPLAASAGCSLREGILMMHQSLGVDLKVQQPAEVKQPQDSEEDKKDNTCASTEL